MCKVNVKNLINTVLAILYFVAINIFIYYGFKIVPEYASYDYETGLIHIAFVYSLTSSVFYYFIIYLYSGSEKFKLRIFIICFISFSIRLLYSISISNTDKIYGTLNYNMNSESRGIFLLLFYLFVFEKINWIKKKKSKLIDKSLEKKSRKKENPVWKVLNFLTESPFAIIFITLQIIVIYEFATHHESLANFIEDAEKPILIFMGVLSIMSLIQLVIVFILNRFSKNKYFIHSIVGILVMLICLVPYLFGYDYQDKIIKIINDKKEASENKKQLEKELASGARNFLENFEVAANIQSAKKGQVVKFGKTFVKNNISNKEDGYYYVIEKNDNILTLVSLYCMDVIDNDFLHDNGNIGYYEYLDNEYYKNAFNDVEKSMLVDIIAKDNSVHKVYLPNTNDMLSMIGANDKSFYGVVNNTLLKEIRRHIVIFNNSYFEGTCKYLLEPHVLKPHTFRIGQLSYKGTAIYDYDEREYYPHMLSIFLRTKIKVALQRK